MWAAAGGVVGSVAAAAPPSPAGTRSRRGAPAPCRAAAPQASPVLERAGTGPETARQGARQPSAARRRRTVDGSSVSSSSVTAAAHWQLPWQQREQVAEGPALAFAGAGAAAPSFEQRPRAAAQRGSSAAGAAGGLSVQLNEPPPRPAVDEATQLGQEQAGEAGSSSSGGSPGDDPGGEKEFFANVGDAIRTLREDYPLLLVKDLNYAIYRDDLTFKDPNITFTGLRTYKAIFWGLRFHGRLLLKAAHVRVLRIWQPEETVIKLRWQINATPRIGGSPGTFDGISIYRLDRRGRVYQHEVTDVQLRDPPITNPLLYSLNFILSPRPAVQQVPCPGSWYEGGEEDLAPEMLGATAPVLAGRGAPDPA